MPFSSGNNIPLLSGENQLKQWLTTIDGAQQGVHILPTPTASGGDMPTTKVLGAAGAAGDYLKSIGRFVTDATRAAVFLGQTGRAAVSSGTAGTAPSGTTTIAVTASSALTATANQYRHRIIRITYIPTSGVAVEVFKKITAHAAFSAATALSFTVDSAVPAGAAITAWRLDDETTVEIQAYNTAAGPVTGNLIFGEMSTWGGWFIHADIGVIVRASGSFTN